MLPLSSFPCSAVQLLEAHVWRHSSCGLADRPLRALQHAGTAGVMGASFTSLAPFHCQRLNVHHACVTMPSRCHPCLQAGLLSAHVGFDALFFGRADYQVGRRAAV